MLVQWSVAAQPNEIETPGDEERMNHEREVDPYLLSLDFCCSRAVTPKGLGGLPVERDRLNVYPWFRMFKNLYLVTVNKLSPEIGKIVA
ncbi:hypothetical protein TNCV_1206461 [Trichonephila clavipes]|nr:hypothetical protein TNCV_1206461 [Trichonephila clavipes]